MTKEEQKKDLNNSFMHYLDDIRSINAYRKRSTILMVLLMLFFILMMTSLFIATLNEEEQWGSKRFVKADMQNKLALIVRHGGSLETVKHIYAAREYKDYSLLDFFKVDNDKYYYEPTSLSFILNDLLVNSYQDSTYQDSIYMAHLQQIRIEHEKKYPFDGLEDTQKNLFENIVIKLGDRYEIVQSDMTKLANEIQHQNQLVRTYLNKSNTSYIISIIALIITIATASYQIYQSHKTNKFLEHLFPEKQDKKNENNKVE